LALALVLTATAIAMAQSSDNSAKRKPHYSTRPPADNSDSGATSSCIGTSCGWPLRTQTDQW
jgi:hypothetical protein